MYNNRVLAIIMIAAICITGGCDNSLKIKAKSLDEVVDSKKESDIEEIDLDNIDNKETEVQSDETIDISDEPGAEIQYDIENHKIITLGADLTLDQKNMMLQFFNVGEEDDVEIMEVNNEQEHMYMDGIATEKQIGKHTYSCTYLEPTEDTGIHIKTVNLNWVTSDMIRNALITAGISDCNIICAAPSEVSGTGALTGIFCAYKKIYNDNINTGLATEELIETTKLANEIGQDKATQLMSDLKKYAIENKQQEQDKLEQMLRDKLYEYIGDKSGLSDKEIDNIIGILKQIADGDYTLEDIQRAYGDLQKTAEELLQKKEDARNFLEIIADFFIGIWDWITGNTENRREEKLKECMDEQLGILNNSNQSVMSDTTVVTATEKEIETTQESNNGNKAAIESESTMEPSDSSNTENNLATNTPTIDSEISSTQAPDDVESTQIPDNNNGTQDMSNDDNNQKTDSINSESNEEQNNSGLLFWLQDGSSQIYE